MKYISEFRNSEMAKGIAKAIASEVKSSDTYRFMEFCGGHTHAIFRYGVKDILPPQIRMVHGPGCPVCVLPIGRIDMAIELSKKENLILCTYGDVMRVPGSGRVSLQQAQAKGSDIRMVYSTMDALQIARENPDKEIVFFAIGFETTAPPTAVALQMAEKEDLSNFSVVCNHVLTPAALSAILAVAEQDGGVDIDGFIGPSHVSTVIGTKPYQYFVDKYQKPIVVGGFEPLDVLQAILMLVKQRNENRFEVENQYTRVVTPEGNVKAQELLDEVFQLRDEFAWRGLGKAPQSAYEIRPKFEKFDAEKKYSLVEQFVPEPKGCECAQILRGKMQPMDCKLFGKGCTPESPVGSCMVSSEGACAAYYTYGRHVQENK
jgi:hydrogenase expression/formation protein HypD